MQATIQLSSQSQSLISPQKLEFRKEQSTSRALNFSANHKKCKQHRMIGIFIDLSIAFGTIDHDMFPEN